MAPSSTSSSPETFVIRRATKADLPALGVGLHYRTRQQRHPQVGAGTADDRLDGPVRDKNFEVPLSDAERPDAVGNGVGGPREPLALLHLERAVGVVGVGRLDADHLDLLVLGLGGQGGSAQQTPTADWCRNGG